MAGAGRCGDRTILVVHADKKTQRTVHRILGGTFCRIELVDAIDEAAPRLAGLRPCMIVIDHEQALLEQGRALIAAYGGVPCLVLMHDPAPDELSTMLGVESLSYLLANPMPLLAEEMTITALKLIRGEIFGLEKYLAWGIEVRERVLGNAGQRGEAIDVLAQEVIAAGLGGRVAAAASLIADELLSNALYNAPIDAAGDRYRGDEPRSGDRELAGREQVTLRYACDARYLAIEVNDGFGSLDRKTILRCMAKSTMRGAEKVSMQTRGAGIGLASVYGTCNHLVFNLQPQVRTEVIALVDVRFRPAELTSAVCSFGVFAA